MKLLLIEDSERLRRTLARGLHMQGYTIETAEDGEQGLFLANHNTYNLIILDLMLPKIHGLSIIKALRDNNNRTNILVLSAMGQVKDKIAGLSLGADDYLAKPFSFDELCARITSIIRRHTLDFQTTIYIKNVEIDLINKQIIFGGQEIILTASEYRLVECLTTARGRTFSKVQLVDLLYDLKKEVTSNVVEVLISTVRKKFRHAGAEDIIVTRRGFGYTVL